MKLYTKSDLARCARIALLSAESDVETAVVEAVELVMAETVDLFSQAEAEEMVRNGARLALQGLPVEDVVKVVVQEVRA